MANATHTATSPKARRKRDNRPHLYASETLPGEKLTAKQIREMAGRHKLNVCQYVQRGVPIKGHVFHDTGELAVNTYSGAPKPIHCRCTECGGKAWTLDEIRALPEVAGGKTVNGLTLPAISRVTHHDFYYPSVTPLGTWRKAKPAARPAEAPREPHRYGSDPIVREMMAIQPKRLDVTFIGGGDGGGA